MATQTNYSIITTEPPGSPAWLKAHEGRIGGSDVASILGVGRKTPLRLWAELTGKIEREDISKLPHIMRGVRLEPVVKLLYQDVTQRLVLPTPGLIAHPTMPWVAGTPDGMVEINGDLGVFEAKTVGMHKVRDWKDETVPLQYQIQCHLYMVLTGCEKASIAAMPIDDDEDGEPVLHRDIIINPVFADHMMDKLAEFREKHWLADIPPEGNWEKDRETIKRMFPKEIPGQVVEMTSEMIELWAQKEQLASQKTAIGKELDAVVARLEAYMGTAERAIGPGYDLKFVQELKNYKATEARVVPSRQIRRVKQ
jgi:putative phage-type endonuclease